MLESNLKTNERGGLSSIQNRLNIDWNHLIDWNGAVLTGDDFTLNVFSDVPKNTSATVIIDSVIESVDTGASPTALTVAADLVDAINATGNVTATDNLDGSFTLTSGTDFTISTNEHLSIDPVTVTHFKMQAAVILAKQIADNYCNSAFEITGDHFRLMKDVRYIVASDSDSIGNYGAGSIFVATRDDEDDFNTSNQLVRRLFKWSSGGYMDLPLAVRLGVLQIASDVYSTITTGGGVPIPGGPLQSEKVGEVSVSYGQSMSIGIGSAAASLSAAAKAFLSPYRVTPIM